LTITHNLFLALVGMAVVPLASGRGRWLSRIFGRRPLNAVAAPPMIENEAGWQLVHSEDADAFNGWLKKDSTGLPLTPNEEPALGSHLLIELFGCEPATLEQEQSVGAAMRDAAIASEATVVTESFHEFKPYGVSGAVIIQESHYTIHTWPEHGYAAVDLFYCGGAIRVDEAVEVLRERFSPKRIKLLIVRRGIESEVRA
jgi:S-adenosylmethionine decarboxylase